MEPSRTGFGFLGEAVYSGDKEIGRLRTQVVRTETMSCDSHEDDDHRLESSVPGLKTDRFCIHSRVRMIMNEFKEDSF